MADGNITFAISADDKDAQKKLNQLYRDIEKTAKALNENEGKRSGIAEQLAVARAEAEKTAEAIRELQEQKTENEAVLSGRAGNADFEEFMARKQAQEEINYELTQQEATLKRQNGEVERLERQESGIADKIATQTANLKQQQTEAAGLEQQFAQTSSNTLPQLHSAIQQVGKEVKKSARFILRWGLGIRSAFFLMRKLRNALKEGIKTFAEYDTETKTNIDNLKTSLNSLKVSWGAAFAPIVNLVTPLLNRLIDALIKAANYVNMFFSALAGKSTYKTAIANADSLKKSVGGAGKAAKDAKKQLMGFDEINKLESKDSGGGGGGGATGYDLSDADIPSDFMDKVEWLKDHFDEILLVAGAIGAALLSWKIAKGISGAGGLAKILENFKMIFGIVMAIAGAVLLVKGYIDAWKNGVDWSNLTEMLLGVVLLVGGLALAFGGVVAGIAAVVSGVALLILGFKEWIQTGELTTQTFLLIEAGLLALGVGIALITGSWIPVLIAAIAMLVMLVIKYWDEISAWLKSAWEAIKGFFVNIWNHVVEFWNKLGAKLTEIKNGIVAKFNAIKQGIVDKITAIRNKVQEVVDKIKGLFEGLHIQLPHIKLPHIVVEWQPAGDLGQFFGINSIPHIGIEWYAKGGIVDGATLIGAGEAGKEAVVPLERHTEWINLVADGIVDRLADRAADIVSQLNLPALIYGSVVPPRALTGGGMLTDADIEKLVNGIAGALTNDAGERVTRLYLDGREIAECVTKHQREMARGYA